MKGVAAAGGLWYIENNKGGRVDFCTSCKKIDKKYLIKELLASGGQGVVYRASSSYGSDVALKILNIKRDKPREQLIERFKHEFSILSRVRHPNILEIYDFGYDKANDLYYFTTEYLEEGNLGQCLNKLAMKDLESLFLEALRALSYLENCNLFHFDIKPANFLIKKKNNKYHLKLIDFGLATLLPSERPGGTRSYMSPEAAYAKLKGSNLIPDEIARHLTPLSKPDHKSDLYSLAVTFYEAFTRENPFKVAGNPDQTMISHLRTCRSLSEDVRLVIPSMTQIDARIPEYLDSLIMRNLEYLPDDRFESASKVSQSLNVRSPYANDPETIETYLSYIPTFTGRDRLHNWLQDACQLTVEGIHVKPIFIAGQRGLGRSSFLEVIKPYAQTLEMEVVQIFAKDPEKNSQLNNGEKGTLLIMVDDIDCLIKKSNNEDESKRLLSYVCGMLQKKDKKILFIFTMNGDKSQHKKILAELKLSAHDRTVHRLKPFSINETREYLDNIFDESPSKDYVDLVNKMSHGHPNEIHQIMTEAIKLGGKYPSIDLIQIENRLMPMLQKETESKDPRKKAYLLINIAHEFGGLGIYSRAQRYLDKAGQVCSSDDVRLKVCEECALLKGRQRAAKDAKNCIDRALNIIKTSKSLPRLMNSREIAEHELRIRGYLGYMKMLGGEHLEAYKTMKAVVDEAKKKFSVEQFKRFRPLIKLGQAMFYVQSYLKDCPFGPNDVLKVLNEELCLARRIKDLREQIDSLYFIAESRRKFRLPHAMKYYNRGLALAKKYKLYDAMARLYAGKGNYYNYKEHKDVPKSMVNHEMAIKLLTQKREIVPFVESSFSFSICLTNAGLYQEAITHLENIKYFIQNGAKGFEAGFVKRHLIDTLIMLTHNYCTIRDFKKALPLNVEAEENAQKFKVVSPSAWFSIFGTRAEIYAHMKDKDNAINYLSISKDYAQKEPARLMKKYDELQTSLSEILM